MNTLNAPQTRDQSSRSTRFEEKELFIVLNSSSNFSQGAATVKLDQAIEGVVRVELIEYKIAGAPVTAGVPNEEYFRFECPRLGLNATSSANHGNAICLALDGARTTRVYSPPRKISDQASPLTLTQFEIAIVKGNGGNAVAGTDYTGIYLTFRVTEDKGAPRLS